MRKIISLFCLLWSYSAIGQYRPDKMECFQQEIDSIIIRAVKDGCHRLKITITPYHGDRILPKKPEPGKIIPITWTKVPTQDEEVGESKITWIFLNDSVVEQKMDGEKHYGLISDRKIFECDQKGNKLQSFWHVVEKDSLRFKIVEQSLQSRKDSSIKYIKTIYDSAGHAVKRYSYFRGVLTRYETFKNYGDTVFTSKTYIIKQDTTFYKTYCNKCDSAGKITMHINTFHVKEWCVIRNDSLALIQELYVSKTLSKDHRLMIDTIRSTNYSIYNTQSPITGTSVITTHFVYDNLGRMISAEDEDRGEGFFWKDEMTINYKENRRK